MPGRLHGRSVVVLLAEGFEDLEDIPAFCRELVAAIEANRL